MDSYDVVVLGGGIGGSIAAKYAAQAKFRTILVEKMKTPRNKACSGIQWPYFSRLLGEQIPRNRLCHYQIKQVEVQLPDGSTQQAPMHMYNFMRKSFDAWLNQEAVTAGADFRDSCQYIGFETTPNEYIIRLQDTGANGKHPYVVKARYIIDAMGLRSPIRMQQRPQDFHKRYLSYTLNYYIKGHADLDPETLYQFWNIQWNDVMFAWVYCKTLDDDQDYWVVGTGCSQGSILERQNSFHRYISSQFNLTGDIVKKEGYASTVNLHDPSRIWLGEGNLLTIGDSAGLLDEVRGVGMDAAALSGRLVVAALDVARTSGLSPLLLYKRNMEAITNQTLRNLSRGIEQYTTNNELQEHLRGQFVSMGVGFLKQSFLNAFRPLKRLVLLPP